ncbi:MAG: PQQ-binding-like beta-propeller repeat protein [Halioglobus sp.]|nr:PQQ-binding-like beta-propeller repeat protein [Halioglobus sp.]
MRVFDQATGAPVWSEDVSRSGCADTFLTAPVVHLRRHATPAFQIDYDHDLVYAGTAHSSITTGSGSCANANRDNRVFAFDAATGNVEWRFNATGVQDVDVVRGMALDPSADLLYVATDRTDSPSQQSLWALDVLTVQVVWSANAGRLWTAPVLHKGRLYVADLSGIFRAYDATDGSALWTLDTGIPFVLDPEIVELGTGEVLIAVPDFFGNVRVIRDDGAGATSLHWFQVPTGDPGVDSPGPDVAATSPVVADATGRALVGADDGSLYPSTSSRARWALRLPQTPRPAPSSPRWSWNHRGSSRHRQAPWRRATRAC